MTSVTEKEKNEARTALSHILGHDEVRKQEKATLDAAGRSAERAKQNASQFFSNMLHDEYKGTLEAFRSATHNSSTPYPRASQEKKNSVDESRTPPIKMSDTFKPSEWAALIGIGATICLPLAYIAVKLLDS